MTVKSEIMPLCGKYAFWTGSSLVQEHALLEGCLFQVGLKEREVCRLKCCQQTILAAWRGAIVHHTRPLLLDRSS